MTESLFPTNDNDLLVSVYQKQGRTLDDLPYTPEFEAIYAAMYGEDGRDAPHISRADLFHRLHNLRKAGKLPRLGRAQSKPPRIEPEHEALLIEIVESHIGAISKRDQLLYHATFDYIANTFNARTGLSLNRHDLWRVLAKLAK